MSKPSSERVLQIPLNLESLVWAILILASLLLLLSSGYRAATFPFTVDESVSFAIFSWRPQYGATANNHLLNTALMQLSSALFGNSEFSLRLSTLFAHALYLVSGLLLLKRVQSLLLRVAGFALLNLNPFMLDFFFLARGYGLGLGWLLSSMYLLMLAYEHKSKTRFTPYLFMSVAAGCLAVLANFTFLNFFLPLVLVAGWLLLTDHSLKHFAAKHLAATLGLGVAAGAFLVFVLNETFDLKNRGELYYGGHTGFINDTLGSLVSASVYRVNYASHFNTWVGYILIGFFAALIILGIVLALRRNPIPFATLVSLMLFCMVALPIIQNTVLDVLYPLGRATLYYVPVLALAITFTFDTLFQNAARRWQQALALLVPVLVAGALVVHMVRSYNPNTIFEWAFDAHDDEAIDLIARDRELVMPGENVRVGNNWIFESSLNFYRVTRGYTWLAPFTRDPINGTDFDYIYAFQEDLTKTPIPNSVILARFADTKTVLLRVQRAPTE